MSVMPRLLSVCKNPETTGTTRRSSQIMKDDVDFIIKTPASSGSGFVSTYARSLFNGFPQSHLAISE